MGEHTEKQFVYLRQKQDRDTHPERKGVAVLPNEEERSKEEVKSLGLVLQHKGAKTRNRHPCSLPDRSCLGP